MISIAIFLNDESPNFVKDHKNTKVKTELLD